MIRFEKYGDKKYLMIGSRGPVGWLILFRYLIGQRFYRILHSLNFNWHEWEFREAPDCGCCGGNEMRCYKCGAHVDINDAIREIWDEAHKRYEDLASRHFGTDRRRDE